MKNFWKNKRVLITGGAGFIGSNITKELIKRNSIIKITISKSTSEEELKQIFGKLLEKIEIQKVDLLSLKDCLKITKDIDVVLNFAALDGGAKFKKEHAKEIYKVNTGIARNILEASRLNSLDRVLLMSSIDVYPKNIKSRLSENDADMTARSGYIGSKVFSEKLAKKYYNKYGLKIAIARPGNIYGQGDKINIKRARVIPTFIKKAIMDENIEILTSENLSFLYIKDLVNALLDLTVKYAVCLPVNIASSNYISLSDLGKLIIKLSNSKSKIILRETNPNIKSYNIIDTSKAKQEIDFVEKENLRKGIESLIKTI